MNGENELDRLKQVQSGVDQLRDSFDRNRIKLVKDSFPDIVDDANKFIDEVYQRQGAFYEPWEYFQIGDEDGEPERIQNKYDIHYQRRRPRREHTTPQADLFFEISEILFRLKLKEVRHTNNMDPSMLNPIEKSLHSQRDLEKDIKILRTNQVGRRNVKVPIPSKAIKPPF